jgi:hypothetical protein
VEAGLKNGTPIWLPPTWLQLTIGVPILLFIAGLLLVGIFAVYEWASSGWQALLKGDFAGVFASVILVGAAVSILPGIVHFLLKKR